MADLLQSTQRLDATIAMHDFEREYAFSAIANDDDVPLDDDPLTIEEALAGPNAAKWQAAMEAQLASLAANNTWTLVPLPLG